MKGEKGSFILKLSFFPTRKLVLLFPVILSTNGINEAKENHKWHENKEEKIGNEKGCSWQRHLSHFISFLYFLKASSTSFINLSAKE